MLALHESKLEQHTLYVAPHNWPVSLHKMALSYGTTLVLDLSLAKKIQDANGGHSHLTDPLYQVSALAKKWAKQ
jgi:hypothetical protein